MMTISKIATIACFGALALAVSACSGAADEADTAGEADSFAARINSSGGTAPVAQATTPARIAEPRPGAVPGPYLPGTQTDPASRTCGANLMGEFMGRVADAATRRAVVEALGRSDNLRFVLAGSPTNIDPDPSHPRLNLMLDAQNVIRDARCG